MRLGSGRAPKLPRRNKSKSPPKRAKQQILAEAVPDLVESLVNPRCLDASGSPVASQPQSPVERCPTGSRREFAPVFDIHIGIISSSLGDYGGEACSFNAPDFDGNDKAHLIHRSATLAKGDVTTYDGSGFLAWDPLQKLDPKGEMVLGSSEGKAWRIWPRALNPCRGSGASAPKTPRTPAAPRAAKRALRAPPTPRAPPRSKTRASASAASIKKTAMDMTSYTRPIAM